MMLVASIQVSLLLAAAAMWLRPARAARWCDTLAWLAYLVHVAVAMMGVHGSHAAAYAHTARRTAELCGIETGVGLYINYLFTLAWSIEVGLAWQGRHSQDGTRAGFGRRAFDVCLWFMTLNGAVIFTSGGSRLWGIFVVAVMTAAMIRQRA